MYVTFLNSNVPHSPSFFFFSIWRCQTMLRKQSCQNVILRMECRDLIIQHCIIALNIKYLYICKITLNWYYSNLKWSQKIIHHLFSSKYMNKIYKHNLSSHYLLHCNFSSSWAGRQPIIHVIGNSQDPTPCKSTQTVATRWQQQLKPTVCRANAICSRHSGTRELPRNSVQL